MKKAIYLIAAFTVLIAVLGAWQLGFFAKDFDEIKGKVIRDVALQDLNGAPKSFSELPKAETVIYFFTSWCAPCYETLKQLEALNSENPFKVYLLAVALDGDLEGVKNMITSANYSGDVWLTDAGTMALQQRWFGNEKRAVPYVIKLNHKKEIIESSYTIKTKEDWHSVLVDGVSLNLKPGS